MQKSGAYLGRLRAFYTDERQTNFLFVHERVKIAAPV
jgi:hypothetical protein